MYSRQEIEERRVVWLALSELFLDTDVSQFYEFIARECAASAFSLEELEKMLINEVMPICGWNLLSVAGVWSGFDEQWLIAQIADGRKPRRQKLARWIFKGLFRREMRSHWQAIAPSIILARTTQG